MFDKQKAAEIKTAAEKWNNNVEAKLEKQPERRVVFKTSSGMEIKRLYTPADIENMDYAT